jgi:hypothetical protein
MLDMSCWQSMATSIGYCEYSTGRTRWLQYEHNGENKRASTQWSLKRESEQSDAHESLEMWLNVNTRRTTTFEYVRPVGVLSHSVHCARLCHLQWRPMRTMLAVILWDRSDRTSTDVVLVIATTFSYLEINSAVFIVRCVDIWMRSTSTRRYRIVRLKADPWRWWWWTKNELWWRCVYLHEER